MRDVRKVCHDHNIYEHRAIWADEMMQQVIIEDLQAMLLHDTVRPLHERLAEYINNHDRGSERAKTYQRKADELRQRQREYYAAHREECIRRVRRSQRAKVIREFNEHFNYTEL